MRKHLKSIAAAILAVVMLMSISAPVMAAEQVPAMGKTEVSEASTSTPIQQIGPKDMYLKPDRVIDFNLHISKAARTIEHKLVGQSAATRGKAVVIRFQNTVTKETRSFTALADAGWLTTTYNTSFPDGDYLVWVVFAGGEGDYNVHIKFQE